MRLLSKQQGIKFFKKFSMISIFIFLCSSSVPLPTSLAVATLQTSQSSEQIEDSKKTQEIMESNILDGLTYQKTSGLEQAKLVREGKITSRELVELALTQISEQNPQLNAVITLRAEAALKEADSLIDTGQPFLGVPLLLKGLGQTLKGESNTNGFVFSKDQVSGGTSAFVKGLQDAGFIIIGQTNFPELGLKNITDSKLYGPTRNPWNLDYQAGGSSGGAGASLAAGMVPVASGSDAGGSIRIPAAWTGTIGLKPSRGVLIGNSPSEKGQAVHFALTRTIADSESLFRKLEKEPLQEAPDLTGMTVAYSSKSPIGTPVSPEAVKAVEKAVTFLKEQGFNLVEVENPIDGVKLMESYYTIGAASAGIVNFLASQKLHRPITLEDVDIVTWALAQTSKTVTKEEVNQAWEFNQEAAIEMADFHTKYPLFLTPTTAYPASKVDDPLLSPEYAEQLAHIDDLPAEKKLPLIYNQWLESLTLTPFTQQANLTGEPAISLPTHISETGLPMGIQFNAARGQDKLLLKIGELFEVNDQFRLLHTNSSEPEISEEGTQTDPSEPEISEEGTQTDPSESEISEEGTQTDPSESEISEEGTQTDPSEPEISEEGTQTDPSEPEISEEGTQTDPNEPEISEEGTQTDPSEPEISEEGTQTDPSEPEISEEGTQTDPSEPEISEEGTQTDPSEPEISEEGIQTDSSEPEISEEGTQTDPSNSEISEEETQVSSSELEGNMKKLKTGKVESKEIDTKKRALKSREKIKDNQADLSINIKANEKEPIFKLPTQMAIIEEKERENNKNLSKHDRVIKSVTKVDEREKRLPQTGELLSLIPYLVGISLLGGSFMIIKRHRF
ncbi:amidase family protein [Vagococcus intermedius]|uniref:Amidase family protein n=1 Tax=Vagococcus intermedius TaxID=2991418 RepID=A0AAF0I7J2_9ENTE|nr:amidase family protein [Vagococcus intermedius]WEG73051.1 amidase family protein [Vagococcus intermedius]WEG75135.1 amidase family protein [Vagococcus intermedius]